MTEEQGKKTRDIHIKTAMRLPSLDVELSSLARPSEANATLDALLELVQAQSKKMVGIASQFSQVLPHSGLESVASQKSISSDPYSKMADDLAVSADELRDSKLIGFKDNKPQILNAAKFPTPEKGCLALFYAFEIGLDKSPIAFEEGEEAYRMSRYTEAFAGRALNNLKNTNKINKSRYDSTHEIVLTPSGVEDAREALKAALAGAVKPTKRRKKTKSAKKRK